VAAIFDCLPAGFSAAIQVQEEGRGGCDQERMGQEDFQVGRRVTGTVGSGTGDGRKSGWVMYGFGKIGIEPCVRFVLRTGASAGRVRFRRRLELGSGHPTRSFPSGHPNACPHHCDFAPKSDFAPSSYVRADPPLCLDPPHTYCHMQAASQRVYADAVATSACAAAACASSIATASCQGAASCSERVADWGVEDCSGSFLECLEDIWERDTTTGFLEFSFDPETQVPLELSPS
jgi:hypothetical protein